MVLERLSAIYEDDWNLIVVLLPQSSVTIDVDLTPYEVDLALGMLESLFDDVAEMTSTARVHYHFVHNVIVFAPREADPASAGGRLSDSEFCDHALARCAENVPAESKNS